MLTIDCGGNDGADASGAEPDTVEGSAGPGEQPGPSAQQQHTSTVGSGGGGGGGGGGLPSPSRAALADVDLLGRLSAHWDVKCAVERLTQLEKDEALARRLQEQVGWRVVGCVCVGALLDG